jgi:RNA polymerase sigma factor for flagellar operon FliA
MPWVRIIAQNIHRSLPANVMLDDLVQDGMIGLIIAFRQHDSTSDVPFQSFAGNQIKWAILDGLRSGDWAEKSVRTRANKVAKVVDKLQANLLRPPTKREIANELGVRVDDVNIILGDAYGFNFVRINNDDESDTQDIPDSRMDPATIVERRESYSRAVECLKNLHSSERKVFILRNMCDMSGRETSVELGLSESRVSQLYKAATEKIADYFQP